jgi:hypothetical protein
MKKRIPQHHLHSKNARKGREVRTGEHCPVNGWWAPTGGAADAHFVAEGSIMPAQKGESVTWKLVASRFGSRKPKYTHPAAGVPIDSF